MGTSKSVQIFLPTTSVIIAQMRAYDEKITDETGFKIIEEFAPKFDHVVAAIKKSKD